MEPGIPVHLHPDQLPWLRNMAAKYNLPDEHKALRVVLRYVMDEADPDTVFGEVRCRMC